MSQNHCIIAIVASLLSEMIGYLIVIYVLFGRSV